MFLGQNALFKSGGRVAGLDRHFRLAEHLARVELFGDDVDRAAAGPVAGFDGAGVRVEAIGNNPIQILGDIGRTIEGDRDYVNWARFPAAKAATAP